MIISKLKNLLLFICYKYIRPFFILNKGYVLNEKNSKVPAVVLTVAFNSYEIIELQYEFLKRYLKIPFDYVLIDNSTNEEVSNSLENFCLKERLTYCKIKNNPYRWPSLSHGHALNIGVKILRKFHASKKYLLVLDHDLIPFSDIGADYFSALATKESDEKIFPWPGLLVLKLDGLSWQSFDFRPTTKNGKIYDTGFALPKDLVTKCRRLSRILLSKREQSNNMQYDGIEIFDGKWLHVVNMSNWAPKDSDFKSIDSIKNLITSLENKK